MIFAAGFCTRRCGVLVQRERERERDRFAVLGGMYVVVVSVPIDDRVLMQRRLVQLEKQYHCGSRVNTYFSYFMTNYVSSPAGGLCSWGAKQHMCPKRCSFEKENFCCFSAR